MDRSQWSRAAHEGLEFMGPYDASNLEEVFEGVDVPIGGRVLDLGCGNGALLRWLAARGPIDGTGVDLNPEGDAPPGVRLVAGDANAFPAEVGSYDLVCSVAAVTPLPRLAELARPDGLVLLGEGYWKQPPSDRYLEALGASHDELKSWDETVAMGKHLGLTLLRSVSSSDEDWDRYEGTWAANGEAFAGAHAGEPGVEEFLEWIRAGRRR
ncbi:MAG TPA: class I SAM-dependent methyltransferase, partial [Gaiellales bacterium]|nr:class I SAM-dependent methyltransferase [Gaiellales bacterium]